MKLIYSKIFVALMLVGLTGACSQDHNLPIQFFEAIVKLSGHQENPAVATTATGSVQMGYDKTTQMLMYTIKWDGLSGAPTGAHIHGPAFRGSNTGVLHNFGASLPATTSGTYTGQVMVDGTSLKEADLMNGMYYFNIHTVANPGGEIRGQIEIPVAMKLMTKMNLPLSPAQEVPAVSSTAMGMMDVVYNKTAKKLSFTVSFESLSGNPSAAHIHGPAAAGANGGVVVPLTSLLPAATMGAFSYTADVDGITLTEADLMAGLYYINIHTAAHGGGEIRGQIVF